jgi:hypothetical protein
VIVVGHFLQRHASFQTILMSASRAIPVCVCYVYIYQLGSWMSIVAGQVIQRVESTQFGAM